MQKANPRLSPKIQYFLFFWGGVLFLSIIKWIFPAISEFTFADTSNTVSISIVHKDEITRASARVDSLLRAPRKRLQWRDDSRGIRIKNKIKWNASFVNEFPDLNDVQLATAHRIGTRRCSNREEAVHRIKELVYIGDNPFFHVKPLSHSIPYLVPRAATLLEEIGRSFADSLTMKGIPFHKLIVTSVLRTDEDIARLRRHNSNASEHSCHRFGTTFDISYNHYIRVQDPQKPPQVETWAGTLKNVLAEVLRDQRAIGTCYIKYEIKQACFHITAR